MSSNPDTAPRKTLADLANANLEARMVEVFNRRLRELADPAKRTLGAALKQGAEPAVVGSHFELAADQQDAIRNAVNETFSADVPLRFETAGDALCGIELNAGGQKLAWTIDGYLRDLEHDVAALLDPAAKPVPVPKRAAAQPAEAAPVPGADPVAA